MSSAADNLRVMASSLDEFDTFRVSHVQALIDEADAANAARDELRQQRDEQETVIEEALAARDAILNDLRAYKAELDLRYRHHEAMTGCPEGAGYYDLIADDIGDLIERHEGSLR